VYNSWNSSILLQPNDDTIQKYSKIKLVPFAERVPWSDVLSFMNAMYWNFGLGGWAVGEDTTVFQFKTRNTTSVFFSNLICYESIYPGFTSEFVRKGAQFLTIITNDSWWGNTSGAYQHKQYAIFRAIENRRWIARCANGGISCFIDPFGRVVESSELFTQKILYGNIVPNNVLTFYSQHGDWFAESCLIVSLLALMACVGKIFYFKIRKEQEDEIH
jgi:apolipoprotein N-acyltransferase